MTLCNQGCGTKIQFVGGRPCNFDKKKTPHSQTCMSLKFGKWWGGKYNTIPMGYVKEGIHQVYDLCSAANTSRNIDTILKALSVAVDNLQAVVSKMGEQEKKNFQFSEEFDRYKEVLVAAQAIRERRKK